LKFGFYAFKSDSVQELTAYSMLADKLNFDYVWVPDEVPAKSYRDPFILLAAIGWNTQKITIGTSITNPYTRHPALIASAFNSLYEITGGRVAIGISVGGELPFKPLKIPMWNRPLTTMKEAVIIIRRLMNGEKVTFEGKIFNIENVELDPKPDKKVPILIGARGPKMLQLAGRFADGVLGSVPIPKIPYMIEMIKIGAEKEKRKLDDFVVSNGIPFAISKKREDAYNMVKPLIALLITFLSDFLVVESGVSKERMEKIRRAVRENNSNATQELITEDIINNFSVSGTTKDIISKLKEVKDMGVNSINVQPPFGDSIEYALKTVSTNVMPHFK